MTRVLIVDDSAAFRQLLAAALERVDGLEVVGVAADPYVARDRIVSTEPDVVTLDIQMPRMDGLTFLGKLMKYQPTPVIVVSSFARDGCDLALQALERGAVDVVSKPEEGDFDRMVQALVPKIRAAQDSRAARLARARQTSAEGSATDEARVALRAPPAGLLAIGASTGGTVAIREILQALPADGPATVVVQHMPRGFTAAFAARLHEQCAMEVREARHGDRLRPGLVLVAPGDRHLLVNRCGGLYSVELKDGPAVHHVRPSVDVLFHSVANRVGPTAVGVLLTGMGVDGARGLLAMRLRGAGTLAQDEATSVVYGMPREAERLGAAERVVPLQAMAQRIAEAFAARVGAS